MRIALVFNQEIECTTGAYIHKLLRRSSHQIFHFWTRDACYLEGVFDLYFRIDHGDHKYDLPGKFHPAAFWTIDTHIKKSYKKIRPQAGHYDYVFCAQKEGAEALKRDTGANTFWVPLGYDPELIRPLSREKVYDVGFVGTDGKKSLRKVLMAELKQRYPRNFIDKAPHTQMAQIYSSSQIGFNYSIRNDINMRMFEIIGAGCLLLTNKIKDNGFSEIFKDRQNCVVYRTPEQLFELVEYYLSHDQERKKIARAGYELSKSHTYQHRLEKMFEIMGIDL